MHWSINVFHMYIKDRGRIVPRAYQCICCSRGNNEGLGKLVRSPVLPPTLERFMRSIANRGGNGLEWINGSQDVVETCKRLRLRSRRRFFSSFVLFPFFFYRFRSLCSTRGESCSFISVVVHCIERSYRTQRCQTEENTATRCERACKTIRIFSTRTKCNPQLDAAYVVSEFIPFDFFS